MGLCLKYLLRTIQKMEVRVAQAIMRRSPSDRAALIGCAPKYITDAGFLNLLNGININARRGSELVAVVSSMRAFAAVPRLAAEVDTWLKRNSGPGLHM